MILHRNQPQSNRMMVRMSPEYHDPDFYLAIGSPRVVLTLLDLFESMLIGMRVRVAQM